MTVVEKNQENLEMCKCMDCPSYSITCKIKEMPHNIIDEIQGIENVSDLEQMFCAYTKSRCINEDKGCMCNECGVHGKYNLEDGSYCISESRN